MFKEGLGRLYNPQEFHNPTEPEFPNVRKNLNTAEINSRIAEIVKNPPGINGTQKDLSRIEELIGDRNLQLYRMNHPKDFPGEPNTGSARESYEKELKKLMEIKKDLEINLAQHPAFGKRAANAFRRIFNNQ